MLRLFNYIVLFAIIISSAHAVTQITEIHPHNAEYVEIYSHKDLNLSKSYVYDSNENTSFNTLEKIKSSNSQFSLIVGSRFIDEHNISSLNCSIYQSSGTQVSKGGLLSGGERISIEKENFTLEWIPEKEFDLLDNQSIDAQLQELIPKTPCDFSPIKKGDKRNITNPSQNEFICYCPDLSITIKEDITNTSIEYSFQTDALNPLIQYWIEYYNGTIAKQKYNTTSLSKKYFTPSEMDVYTIKAKLYGSECRVYDENQVVFYKKDQPILKEINSSIIIKNKKKLQQEPQEEILYEISRGDTRKRVVKFFLDEYELASLYLNKFSSIKGRLFLNKQQYKNLFISGLGINKSISLYSKKEKTPSSSSGKSTEKSQKSNTLSFENQKMSLNIKNISIEKNNLSFFANSTHKGNFQCYVINKRTKLSEEIQDEISQESKKFTLTFFHKKIKEKNMTQDNELFCKYKKFHLKTFDSIRIPISLNISNITQEETFFYEENATQYVQKNSESKKEVIESRQITLKQKVIYGILLVLVILVTLFIVFW